MQILRYQELLLIKNQGQREDLLMGVSIVMITEVTFEITPDGKAIGGK